MKKVIILSIVIIGAISCQKSVPIENVKKEPVFIRVYNPENYVYSNQVIVTFRNK